MEAQRDSSPVDAPTKKKKKQMICFNAAWMLLKATGVTAAASHWSGLSVEGVVSQPFTRASM